MLEASTLQQQQLNGQKDENTPIQAANDERVEQSEQTPNEANLLFLATGEGKFQSCDQWVHSTIKHQQGSNDDDELSSSKQSTNDDDELDSDGRWKIRLVLSDQFLFVRGHGTTTDTDNDNDLLQSTSTTRPSYPVNIIPSDGPMEIQSNSSQHLSNTSNQVNNELAIYSTSVASGASIETLKPSTSPVKQPDLSKSKPSSWADLFRSQAAANTQASLPTPTPPPVAAVAAAAQATSPTKKAPVTPSSLARSFSGTQISAQPQNGNVTPKSSNNTSYSRPNYHVYNSSGGESKSLEGQSKWLVLLFTLSLARLDYFTKCEVRPSAMAIKPRGLQNKDNYCYVNAVCSEGRTSNWRQSLAPL